MRRPQQPLQHPVPTAVYELEGAAILADRLHNTALARPAEADAARRQATAQSRAAVEATAAAHLAAPANAVTLAEAVAYAEATTIPGPSTAMLLPATTA